MAPASTQQFEVLETGRAGNVTHPLNVSREQREADLSTFHKALFEVTGPWPNDIHRRFPPFAIYLPQHHVKTAANMQHALDKALTSIIERWFTDKIANFPARMPLEESEERVLQWIEGPGKKLCPPYRERKGLFRPDFLLESVRDASGSVVEHIRVCEINARMPFNAFFIVPYLGQIARRCADLDAIGLKPSMDDAEFEEVKDGIFGMFDESKPVHIIMGKFPGFDIHFFKTQYAAKTGQPARIIPLEDLRLRPDTGSPTGYKLFCVAEPSVTINGLKKSNGTSGVDGVNRTSSTHEATAMHEHEILEPVYQVSLELMQPELATMSFEMRCHIATCCVNPLRSIYLVNDERMLGVLFDELDDLVEAQGVLTREEADLLRNGIAASFLPSSKTWAKVAAGCRANPMQKDGWVLKASRDAFGHGHVFGREVNNDEWLAKLDAARECNSHPDVTSFILQKRIDQVEYSIVRHGVDGNEKYHLVGSWLSLSGRFAGIGPWRIARRTHIPLTEDAHGIGMVAFIDA